MTDPPRPAKKFITYNVSKLAFSILTIQCYPLKGDYPLKAILLKTVGKFYTNLYRFPRTLNIIIFLLKDYALKSL